MIFKLQALWKHQSDQNPNKILDSTRGVFLWLEMCYRCYRTSAAQDCRIGYKMELKLKNDEQFCGGVASQSFDLNGLQDFLYLFLKLNLTY